MCFCSGGYKQWWLSSYLLSLFPLGDLISYPNNGWASQVMRNPKGCGSFIEEQKGGEEKAKVEKGGTSFGKLKLKIGIIKMA